MKGTIFYIVPKNPTGIIDMKSRENRVLRSRSKSVETKRENKNVKRETAISKLYKKQNVSVHPSAVSNNLPDIKMTHHILQYYPMYTTPHGLVDIVSKHFSIYSPPRQKLPLQAFVHPIFVRVKKPTFILCRTSFKLGQ
jgi:hypothetical protein